MNEAELMSETCEFTEFLECQPPVTVRWDSYICGEHLALTDEVFARSVVPGRCEVCNEGDQPLVDVTRSIGAVCSVCRGVLLERAEQCWECRGRRSNGATLTWHPGIGVVCEHCDQRLDNTYHDNGERRPAEARGCGYECGYASRGSCHEAPVEFVWGAPVCRNHLSVMEVLRTRSVWGPCDMCGEDYATIVAVAQGIGCVCGRCAESLRTLALECFRCGERSVGAEYKDYRSGGHYVSTELDWHKAFGPVCDQCYDYLDNMFAERGEPFGGVVPVR